MGIETALAAAVVSILSPFMPALTEAGQDAAQRIASAVGKQGGEAAWNLAQTIWSKITARFQHDPEISNLSRLVAAKPDRESYQAEFAEVLADRLSAHPDLVRELTQLLGGEAAVQRIALGNRARIQNVEQRMAGRGQQTIEAKDDAQVIDSKQVMGGGA